MSYKLRVKNWHTSDRNSFTICTNKVFFLNLINSILIKLVKIILVFFIVVWTFVPEANSQVVNIEKKRKDNKTGFQGQIGFALNITQNTKQILEGNNNINLQYSRKKSTFLLFNDYTIMQVRNSDQNQDLINKNFQHIRYNYTLRDSGIVTFETFLQRQQNKIKYINFRGLFGVGPRFKIIDNNALSFYLAPLFMYEQETLSDSLQTKTRNIKGDFYTTISLNIGKNATFSHVTYFQPAIYDFDKSINFERFSDYRISSETSLTLGIIKNKLELKLIYELSYDSRPPSELTENPLFYTLKNQLTFKF